MYVGLTLGKKIVLSFVLLSVILGGLGIVWEFYYAEITNKQLQESRKASQIVEFSNEMEVSLYQSLLYLNSIREVVKVERGEQTIQLMPSKVHFRTAFEQELLNFEKSFSILNELLTNKASLQSNVSELESRYFLYKSLSSEWLSLIEDDPDEANITFLSSIEPYFRNNIMPKVAEIRTGALNVRDNEIEELNKELRTARLTNIIASTFALFLGILLAFYIYRSVKNPLSQLVHSANQIGEGNLKERVHINSADEIGFLANAFNEMVENLERKTISTDYLDNVLESIREAILVTDDKDIVTRINGSAAKLLGYSNNEIIGKPLQGFFYLVNSDGIESERKEEVSEYKLITRSKEYIPVLFSRADLVEKGRKKGTVNVVTDISNLKEAEMELKKALDEKGIMLAEIHHRVKNNLAVISGLLQLQGYHTKNEEITEALKDSQFRIQSMALVHEKLYESENLAYIDYDRYVKDLMQAIISMHESTYKSINLSCDMEGFSLSIGQAIPASLLLNEIIVNSFKHAFTEQEKGEIIVSGREINSKVIIEISDDGKGVSQENFFKSKSLGSTLIKTLTDQLNGDLAVLPNEKAQKGTIFKLEFEKDLTM